MTDPYIVSTDSTTTSSHQNHVFFKSDLFQSWNLYISGLSVLLNLLGNPVIILVIYKTPSMQSFTHYLFVNLAVSDIALGISSIVTFVVRETMKEGSTNIPPNWICKLLHACPFSAVSMIVSSYSLSVITCERYYHISRPLNARVAQRNTKLIVGLIWSCAITLIIPVPMYSTYDRGKQSCHVAVPHLPIYVISITFLAFVLPLAVMVYCYYQTVRILWFKAGQQSGDSQSHVPAISFTLRKQRKKITKFLGVVLTAFISCSLPVAGCLIARRYTAVPNILFFSSIILAMFSSSINPVIFMLQNSQFREGLKSLVNIRNHSTVSPDLHVGSLSVADGTNETRT